jgi:hypothetical protein
LIDDNAKQMRLAGVAGIDAQTSLSPLAINLESEQPWPLSTGFSLKQHKPPLNLRQDLALTFQLDHGRIHREKLS